MSLSTSTNTDRRRATRSAGAIAANARSSALWPRTVGTAAGHHRDSLPPIVPNLDDSRAQIQLDGDAQRVETAAEIGDGAGDDDLVGLGDG